MKVFTVRVPVPEVLPEATAKMIRETLLAKVVELSEREILDSLEDACPGCGTVLKPTSGGKLQCRGCGYLVTCCE